MKYIFCGTQMTHAIKGMEFANFLGIHKDSKKIDYHIVSKYKNDYIDTVSVTFVDTGVSRTFSFAPSAFIHMETWNLLFKPKDQFVQETFCGKKYRLREENRTGKYKVTVNVLKSLYQRNSVWKLAAHGISSKKEDIKPTVVPLSVKGGRIIRMAIIKPHTVIAEEITYSDIRYAPSVSAFLDIYEEVPEQTNEPWITQEIGNKIIEKISSLANMIGARGILSDGSVEQRTELYSFIRGLVK